MRRRLHSDERGFTLIELLVTLIILAILLAIAIPSYLSFRGRASDTSAQANIRAIMPSVSSYYSDNNTYVGMTLANLQSTYDQAIDTTKYSLPAADLSASSFCISSTVVGQTWSKTGPAGTIVQAACP
jgi:type IV pilus assembly protein PilE